MIKKRKSSPFGGGFCFSVDNFLNFRYNTSKFIGQFATILSVNKTRNRMGILCPFFIFVGADCAHFLFWSTPMNHHARHLAHAAILAALYAVLTYFQNLIFPGSGTWALQLRLSESLCVLAFFTPAAPAGLAIGCLIFNLAFAPALPLDLVLGTLATWLSARAMWRLRSLPLLGLWMPALFNGILVGISLSVSMGGGLWMNMTYVAAGEAAVLLTLGAALSHTMKKRGLDKLLFGR